MGSGKGDSQRQPAAGHGDGPFVGDIIPRLLTGTPSAPSNAPSMGLLADSPLRGCWRRAKNATIYSYYDRTILGAAEPPLFRPSGRATNAGCLGAGLSTVLAPSEGWATVLD